MQLRFLGVHNTETAASALTAVLIDDALAVDAGALSRALSFEEQCRLQAILVTHRHFDHVRDLATVGMATRGHTITDVVALPSVHDAVIATLLAGTIWSPLYERPDPAAPSLRRVDATPGCRLALHGYSVVPFATTHSVPSCGYRIEQAGRSLVVTGDTDERVVVTLAALPPADVLVIETTYSDAGADLAREQGHLTPAGLRQALEGLGEAWSRCRVAVVHRDPRHEPILRDEVMAGCSAWDVRFPATGEVWSW